MTIQPSPSQPCSPPTIGVAIFTYNSQHHLKHCIPPLLASPLSPTLLVIDSSSSDDSVKEAENLSVETLTIPKKAFNHGLTRELARKRLNTDIVVMMTPDAYPIDNQLLTLLTAPILSHQASIAYARQIPHEKASFWETFPRSYNYPQKSHIRSIDDAKTYGPYLFFCSNSCAAYRNAALDEIGGFQKVLIGEDTCATAKLLQRGHKIAYVAEAVVKHSHRYSLKQEFHRYFDTGLARRGYRNLIALGGRDESRGKNFLVAMNKQLAKEKPYLIPYGLLHTATKWLGYKLGNACYHAPTWLQRRFSAQKNSTYWYGYENSSHHGR